MSPLNRVTSLGMSTIDLESIGVAPSFERIRLERLEDPRPLIQRTQPADRQRAIDLDGISSHNQIRRVLDSFAPRMTPLSMS
jgi:hypothetical protein